ncbi:MAG: tRNA pseudouridine(38-40) synthase TruA [Lachnospiraceae bacterium]|nr:tRNA pseudouridine(38-40) synthase TruA [Lachnospiraceae bacterium]
MRVMMRVAYDGTGYCGWQRQPNGLTVQEVLETHLAGLLGAPTAVIGASRTDSGVHALGNIAMFDAQTQIPAEKISYALNQRLPEDIRIRGSREVPEDFHPRKCNAVKTYSYRIWNSRYGMPLLRDTSYFVFTRLDVPRMREAAAHFIGTHDFTSFCSPRTDKEDKVRTIYRFDLLEDGPLLTMRISGNGFLYHMVRIMAGTLLCVGEGSLSPDDIPRILDARDRQAAPRMVPARGLTLEEIRFEEDSLNFTEA